MVDTFSKAWLDCNKNPQGKNLISSILSGYPFCPSKPVLCSAVKKYKWLTLFRDNIQDECSNLHRGQSDD